MHARKRFVQFHAEPSLRSSTCVTLFAELKVVPGTETGLNHIFSAFYSHFWSFQICGFVVLYSVAAIFLPDKRHPTFCGGTYISTFLFVFTSLTSPSGTGCFPNLQILVSMGAIIAQERDWDWRSKCCNQERWQRALTWLDFGVKCTFEGLPSFRQLWQAPKQKLVHAKKRSSSTSKCETTSNEVFQKTKQVVCLPQVLLWNKPYSTNSASEPYSEEISVRFNSVLPRGTFPFTELAL